ncbi:MAG: type II secretion system F family protein [Acidobacteria bacterium]|nr:type II secretion system F family protein [Acidobacteriota bacterium]
MVEILTGFVFILVVGGSVVLGSYLDAVRSQAVRRLRPEAAARVPVLPSPWLVWRELVARIGTMVPASSKDQPALKRRLIRAGFRNPHAGRYFYGFRAVGVVVLGGLALFVGLHNHNENTFLLVGAMGWFGFMAPSQYLSVRIRRRAHQIEKGLPNALDLMVVCVESGLGMDQAILQVARELMAAHPEISEELSLVNLELRAGKRRAEALHNLAGRTGVEDVKKLVAVLVQTDRFGTSIAQSLRGHADYLRTMARQRAEEQASKLAVKLVFPIFFCVLPSLFAVTVGPVITRLVRDLIPMIENT